MSKTGGNKIFGIPIKTVMPVLLTGTVLVLALVFYFVTPLSAAWFSANEHVGGSGFELSLKVRYSEVNMWTYVTEEENPTDNGWMSLEIDNSTPFFNTVGGLNEKDGGKFLIKSLALGTVDNLVKPKLDNYTYFVFKITPEKEGEKFTVKFNMPEKSDGNYPFTIYDKDDNQVIDNDTVTTNESVYDELAISEGQKLLKISYFVSDKKYSSPDGFEDTVVFRDYIDETNGVNTYTSTSLDTYYVYVRICPKPETLATIAKYLYAYMPCIFIYNLEIEYFYGAE